MNDCPLCHGRTIIRISSHGEEIYCAACRNILKSATLGYQVRVADLDDIEQCSVNGLPGWKGPSKEAKCYTYDSGNRQEEEYAKDKARASAHSLSKRSFVEKTAIAFFTKGETPWELFNGDEETKIEASAIDGTTTEDDTGTEVQPLSTLNEFSASALEEEYVEGLDQLGHLYFTAPCPKCGIYGHLEKNCSN